jgi:hypothetical protein
MTLTPTPPHSPSSRRAEKPSIPENVAVGCAYDEAVCALNQQKQGSWMLQLLAKKSLLKPVNERLPNEKSNTESFSALHFF